MINKVISGGQTGADLGGLLAAERVGIATGGLAPKGYYTEKGNQPILGTRFGLTEDVSPGYTHRTGVNVRNSDVTLILATEPKSYGTVQTIRYCDEYGRRYKLINPFIEDASVGVTFLRQHRPNVVNIAGNRETVSPGLTKITRDWLINCFTTIIDGR